MPLAMTGDVPALVVDQRNACAGFPCASALKWLAPPRGFEQVISAVALPAEVWLDAA